MCARPPDVILRLAARLRASHIVGVAGDHAVELRKPIASVRIVVQHIGARRTIVHHIGVVHVGRGHFGRRHLGAIGIAGRTRRAGRAGRSAGRVRHRLSVRTVRIVFAGGCIRRARTVLRIVCGSGRVHRTRRFLSGLRRHAIRRTGRVGRWRSRRLRRRAVCRGAAIRRI